MITIEEQILQNAKLFPNKIALIAGETTVTYGELWDRCLKTADVLRSRLALKKGDRVIIAATGNIEFVYTYFGVHIAGGICVPIDPDTNQTRFDYIYESTKPVAVLGVLHKVERKPVSFEEITTGGESVVFEPSQMNNVADVLFTTGTTGAPKGVALSYKNVAAAAQNINTFIQNGQDDIELLALPVSHSFGLGRVKCVLTKGGTLVMLGTFASMKKFFGNMEKHHCTGFGMVPASWGYIKKMSGQKIGKFADQLKYVEIGSSFMSKEDKELLMQLLPNTRICMHYGSTEASRSSFMEFHSCKDDLLTAGHASPNCDIKIFSPEGKELPHGEEGEVCVKGDHVTCSYWNESPERFASDFYGDYFRTGDSGVQDDRGYIYLKSRIKEMINVGGKKVAPMEVEDMLNAIPGIKESACVSIPDPDGVMGELVKAFIVCDDETLSDAAILDALRPKLEVYKLPVAFERIAEVPKTSSGKIQRLKLKN
jgi:long-chain acyl-CoA synthetase